MNSAQIVTAVMDRWRSAIDLGEAARVADVFTDDAVFQGLRPYSVGRQAVADYYGSQPAGMTVNYRLLESRFLTDDVVTGYVSATFSYIDHDAVDLAIGVVLRRRGDRWEVAQYQASQLP